MQNSDFWTRITNLYGSQTSPVVLCIQYSVISTRITCLYGSQPKSVFFACKTATFGEELQVSMCHSSHLWFLHTQQRILDQNFKSVGVPDFICGFCMQNSAFWTRISCLYGSQPSSAVFACQTASFGPELQVTMGPRPHLPFCAIKTVWFAPEYQVYIGSSPHLWFCAYKTATFGPE